MQLPRLRKTLLVIFSALAILCGSLLAYRHWKHKDEPGARFEMLGQLPADSDAIFFLDLDALRGSPFLAQVLAWAPQPSQDTDYAQFVKETGLNYERDLDRVALAIVPAGTASNYFLEAEGRFNRGKIEAYAAKYGKPRTVSGRISFALPLNNSATGNSANSSKTVYLTFLREDRIALSSAPPTLTTGAPQPISPDEWREQFQRLAGAPLFAIFFQDNSLLDFAQRAPGGYRSPQLAALLAQLQWLTIAAKPEGDTIRVVADGESSSESVVRQLQEMLSGIAVLARAGLSQPRTRREVDPQVRQALVGLLDSADIQKTDRGASKSVRVSFIVTPKLLETGRTAITVPGTTSH